MFYPDNAFKAIVSHPDPSLRGGLLSSLCHRFLNFWWDAGTGLMVIGNTFESNVTSLALGDNNSYGQANTDVTFMGNMVTKSSSGAAMNYTGITAGNWANTTHDIRLIDMSYANGAVPGVTSWPMRHRMSRSAGSST